MSGIDAIPSLGWIIGAVLSYVLLLRVQPMRELFGRGLQVMKRYRHLPLAAGVAFAAHAVWLWLRGEPPMPGPHAVGGLAPISSVTPYALLGMVEGAFRPFVTFIPAAPVSALVFAALLMNLWGILRELRDGLESRLRPGSAVVVMCLFAASGVLHLAHLAGMGHANQWARFALAQGGAVFEAYATLLGQSYVLLFAAFGLVTLRRNLKKKEILRIAVRRSPRLWPLLLAYAAVVPSVRAFVPPESPARLVLAACVACIAVLLAFLQLDLLGEKRFSGWRSVIGHALDLQRRHFHFTFWFTMICMVHWLVFHLVATWLFSGLAPASAWAAAAAGVLAFLQGMIAVWFVGVWAVLYQEKLAH